MDGTIAGGGADPRWQRLGAGDRTVLAWCASGADVSSGPRTLLLAPDGPGGPAALGVPGSRLDAGLLTDALICAADLELGSVTTGLTTETLARLRHLGPDLDAAWAADLGVATSSRLLDDVLAAGPSRGPVGLEAAFGAVLARALEQGLDPGGVDVSLLRDAAGPLEDLLAELPVWGDGLSARLVLDEDVMHLSRIAWRLLHVTHLSWFGAHNRAVGGDPHRVRHHPVDTWARQAGAAAASVVARVHVLRSLDGAEEELGALVRRHFSWSASSDADGFASWLDGRVLTPVERMLVVSDPVASNLAVRLDPFLPQLQLEEDVVDAVEAVAEYLQAWVLTDAGLLARLHRELHLASDSWAWRRLDLPAHGPEWTAADVAGAGHDLAAALGAGDLLPR